MFDSEKDSQMALTRLQLRLFVVTVCTVAMVISTSNAEAQGTRNPRVASSTTGNSGSKLDPAIKVAQSALSSARKVPSYEATFTKRELVRNTMMFHTALVKVRQRPFSVYLGFRGQHDGREALYVQGRNDGNLLAHDSGLKALVGTISLNPTSQMAMEESRHPITEMGIVNLVQLVITQWQNESKFQDVELKYYPQAKLGKMQCKVIETSHKRRRQGVQFHTTRLYIDRATNLPVRVEQYGFNSQGQKGALLEEYTYSNINVNSNLTDFDFDPRNQDYAF